MSTDFDDILAENRRRNDRLAELHAHPDFDFDSPIDPERCRHDFRYWAARAVTIRDKKTGRLVPFVLNRAQTEVLGVMEKMRLADKPIRLVMLKARQWGGSTLVQVYMAWIQLLHRRNWHSVICAHVKDSAGNIRAMFSGVLARYPAELCDDNDGRPYAFRRFEGSANVSLIDGRNCRVAIASAENHDSIRGADIAMAHLSEVAFWKDSTRHDPADFMRAVCSSIPLEPLSLLVIESTANGVGNFFHREWQRAVEGASDKVPVFIPWHKIEIYTCPVDDAEALWNSLNEYERNLWTEHGCTLEQIQWYRNKSREYSHPADMSAEFPTTDVEAFSGSVANVFPVESIEVLRRDCREGTRGEIRGGCFAESADGKLEVWQFPQACERYVASVDVGGRSRGADWSVIAVLRAGERPEVVAQWRDHTYHDLLGDIAVEVARFYNNALLVIESNTLESANEETSSATVLERVAEAYPNTYRRKVRAPDPDAVGNVGFHTNRNTKARIIDHLAAAIRCASFTERSALACYEFTTYSRLPNGSYAARKGFHDDVLMTRALALYILATEPDLVQWPEDPSHTSLSAQWDW